MSESEFEPNWASPPGDTIRDILTHHGKTAEWLCEALGMSLARTIWLLRGWVRITPEMADKLADVVGVSPGFWLRRDEQYRKAVRRLSSGRRGADLEALMSDPTQPFGPVFTKPLTVYLGPTLERRRRMLADAAQVPDSATTDHAMMGLEDRLNLNDPDLLVGPGYDEAISEVLGEPLPAGWQEDPPMPLALAGPLVRILVEAARIPEDSDGLLLLVESPELGLDHDMWGRLMQLIGRAVDHGRMHLVMDCSRLFYNELKQMMGADQVTVIECGPEAAAG